MSLPKSSRDNMQVTSIDSEFIGLINSLNDSIKEFYSVAKYNSKETNTFLELFDPLLNSIVNLTNKFSVQNNQENISKILDNIVQCKNILNQVQNNSNLNYNNLNLFFDDAKILFQRMRKKRNDNLRKLSHSLTRDKNNFIRNNHFQMQTLNNYSLKKGNLFNSKKIEISDHKKIISLVLKLKEFNEIIGNNSPNAKNNFINLQKTLINLLTKKETYIENKKEYLNSDIIKMNVHTEPNNNFDIIDLKIKYENNINKLKNKIKELEKNNENILLISNKAKKYDELKQKFELGLNKGDNVNDHLLSDSDFETRINNLIDTNNNLNSTIKKLRTSMNNLDLDNIQLKQDLLAKEKEMILLQSDTSDKDNAESIIKLKKNLQKLLQENNLLKEKIKSMNSQSNSINIKEEPIYNNKNIYMNNINSLNKKIEELSKLLTTKMEQIISLEKENINLKSLLSDTASNSSYSDTKQKKSNNQIKVKNNINAANYLKLLKENKKLKVINDTSRKSFDTINKENQELKLQIQNLGMNNNYIMNMQQELDQLRKIIEENNLNNSNKNSEYELKIINLQNILNEKEDLLNKYETQTKNMDLNKLMKEIGNKDKNILELKNKAAKYEKQIILLNKKLKNNNPNNNELNYKIIELTNHINQLQNENQALKDNLSMNKSIETNKSKKGNEKEVEVIKKENKNLVSNINQLKQEILKLRNLNEITKREKDSLQQTNKDLLSQNAMVNQKNSELLQQVNSIQNLNINNEEISSQIKKKDEEIEGLNTFIQKLSKECEKARDDLENYQNKTNVLQKENTSLKKQLERLAVEMPKELNALKVQLDEANKKLIEANIPLPNKLSYSNNNIKSKNKDIDKTNKTFDDGMQPEKYNNILSKLNQEISDLKKENKELLFKLEDKEVKSQNSRYKTEDLNMSGYEEEFDLRKMATGAREKNRSEDINIDYPGVQGYKEKMKEYQFRIDNLEEQIKILLSKIKITTSIKPTFVQICQLLGYSSSLIEKMANSEKEKKKILGV